MTVLVLGFALGMALAPIRVHAEGGAPDSRRALLQAAGPAPASPDTTWDALENVLLLGPDLQGGIVDGATLPDARPEIVLERVGALSCGTPLMRAAERALPRAASDRQAGLRLLASPPRLAAELAHAVSGEPLVIRWDASAASRHALLGRDSDGDRIPDAVQATAEEARSLLERIGDLLGAPRDPAAPIEIRLAATPFAEGATLAGAGAGTIIVLPRDLRGPERLAALSHQLAHALLSQYPDVPESLEEAIATWLGETAFAEAAGLRVPAADLLPQRHAARSLLSPGIGAARDDAGFLRFATDVLGLSSTWIGDALGALPRHAEDARRAGRLAAPEIPLAAAAEALDESLQARGLTLSEAVAEHQAWSLEQELLRRDASPSVDRELDVLPETVRLTAADVPAFGQLRFGVQVPENGGLAFEMDSAEPLRAQLVASLADGSVRRFPLDGSPLTLPASALRRAVVLVQSPSIPRRWSRWAVPSFEPDESRLAVAANPAWPFSLASIEAEPQPGQVTLSWETSSEEEIQGWIVERALRPAGPWIPLSDAPLPAQSWPDAAASYSFVDATPRPSQRYHYRVRALTAVGIGELSPATSVRSLPKAR